MDIFKQGDELPGMAVWLFGWATHLTGAADTVN